MASHAEIRELAGFVFDMADQIQQLFRARRRALDLDVTKALADLASGGPNGADRRRALCGSGAFRPRLEPRLRQLAGARTQTRRGCALQGHSIAIENRIT